jgi:PPOX class probable F420-dependent enzyme
MSRRNQIQMTDAELRDFLAKSQTIIITSINRDGMPHPMPMWYGVEPDGSVVMTTFTRSQKIRNIERDPRVTLLVEDGTIYGELRGVVIYGKADLVRDTDQVVEILARVSTKALDNPDDSTRDNIRKAVRGTAPKRTGIRVHPDRDRQLGPPEARRRLLRWARATSRSTTSRRRGCRSRFAR